MLKNKKPLYGITLWRLPCSNSRSENSNQIPETQKANRCWYYTIREQQVQIMQVKCRKCYPHFSSCNQISSRYYLPLHHDVISSNVLKMIIKKNHQEGDVKLLNEPEYVIKFHNHEYWWNMSSKTATKISHDKPDLLVWDTDGKRCQIIEFSCPCDVNLIGNTSNKINNYGPLIRNLQIWYLQYRFKMIQSDSKWFKMIIGALGHVVKSFVRYVKQLGFEEKDVIYVIRKLQSLAKAGMVKICKSFLKFNDGS